jgi:hypothetical protein
MMTSRTNQPKPPRTLMAVLRGSTPNHVHLRQRLAWLIAFTVVMDLASSVIAWLSERNQPRSDIHSYSDALFWTTTQLLTVSSQMRNPVTGLGMVLDVGMEFFGITIVAALAGSFGSFLYRRSMERSPPQRHDESAHDESAHDESAQG